MSQVLQVTESEFEERFVQFQGKNCSHVMVKYMSSYFIEETQDELDILSRSELNFFLFPFL